MLSVIVHAARPESAAALSLAALVGGVLAGHIADVSLVDETGDATLARLADEGGCALHRGVDAAAAAARQDWALLWPAGISAHDPWLEHLRDVMGLAVTGTLAGAYFRAPPPQESGWRGLLSAIAGRYSGRGVLLCRTALLRGSAGGVDAVRQAKARARASGRLLTPPVCMTDFAQP